MPKIAGGLSLITLRASECAARPALQVRAYEAMFEMHVDICWDHVKEGGRHDSHLFAEYVHE